MKEYKKYVLGGVAMCLMAVALMTPIEKSEAFWPFGKAKKENNTNYTGVAMNANNKATTTPSITVISPNGGEVLQGGKVYTIKWKSTGFSKREKASVILETHKEKLTEWIFIASSTPNNGFYKWKAPTDISGSNFTIAINIGFVTDRSDNFFSIVNKEQKPSITVVYPNGGEEFSQGQSVLITWKQQGANLEKGDKLISLEAINSKTGIITEISKGIFTVSTTTPFSWDIPFSLNDGDYKIRINLFGLDKRGVPVLITKDESDGSFKISKGLGLACFLAGTKIAMSNELQKGVEDIKIGDRVKSLNVETGKTNNAKVVKVIKKIDPSHLTINNLLKTVPDQKMYTKEGFKQAQDLKIGDYLLSNDNNWIKVSDISPIVNESVETYDLVLDGGNTFYADGYLAHSVEE